MRAVFAKLAAELGVEGSLLEPELTEEEMAEREAAWENVVAFELDTLRAAGRDAGLTGVLEWFDRRGLRFDLSATGVHRVMFEREHPPPRMLVAAACRRTAEE